MKIKHNGQTQKTAVMLVNNEIISNAVKKILLSLGYKVSHDISLCVDANVAFIDSYFSVLGILKEVRVINPSLTQVLIVSGGHKMENIEFAKDVYDVISLDSHNEAEIKQKILKWFSEGQGKLLELAPEVKGG